MYFCPPIKKVLTNLKTQNKKMKHKIITSFTSLAIVGGLIFTLHSCKKETSTQPQSPANAFNVSVAENPTDGAKAFSISGTRLAFPTITDYRSAIDNPTLIAETALITTINAFPGFTS